MEPVPYGSTGNIPVILVKNQKMIPVIGVPQEMTKQKKEQIAGQKIKKAVKVKASVVEKRKQQKVMDASFVNKMEYRLTAEEKLNYDRAIEQKLANPEFNGFSKNAKKKKKFELRVQFMREIHQKMQDEKRQTLGLSSLTDKKSRKLPRQKQNELSFQHQPENKEEKSFNAMFEKLPQPQVTMTFPRSAGYQQSQKNEKSFSNSYEQPTQPLVTMTIPPTMPATSSGGYQYLNSNWLDSLRNPPSSSTTSSYTDTNPASSSYSFNSFTMGSSYPSTSTYSNPSQMSSFTAAPSTSSSYPPEVRLDEAVGYPSTANSSSFFQSFDNQHFFPQDPNVPLIPDESLLETDPGKLAVQKRIAEIDLELEMIAVQKREFEIEAEIKKREKELKMKEKQIAMREKELKEREHRLRNGRSRSRSGERERSRHYHSSSSFESRHRHSERRDHFSSSPSSSFTSQRPLHRPTEITIGRRDRPHEDRYADAARRHGQRSDPNKRIGGRLSRRQEGRSSYYTDDNRLMIETEDISDDE